MMKRILMTAGAAAVLASSAFASGTGTITPSGTVAAVCEVSGTTSPDLTSFVAGANTVTGINVTCNDVDGYRLRFAKATNPGVFCRTDAGSNCAAANQNIPFTLSATGISNATLTAAAADTQTDVLGAGVVTTAAAQTISLSIGNAWAAVAATKIAGSYSGEIAVTLVAQ